MKSRTILIALQLIICIECVKASDYLLFTPDIGGVGSHETEWGLSKLYLHQREQAFVDFEKSDSIGSSFGTYFLSYLLEEKEEVDKSMVLLMKSAQADCFLAKYTLGEKYRLGHSVKKDLSQAKCWLEKAVEESQNKIFYTEYGSKRQHIRWSAYCCNALAQARLGLCYIEEQRKEEGLALCKTAYNQLKKAYENGVNADTERESAPKIRAFSTATEALLSAYWTTGDKLSAYNLLRERVKLVDKNHFVYLKVVRGWHLVKEGFKRDNFYEFKFLLEDIGKDKELTFAESQYAVGNAIHKWNHQERIHPWALTFLNTAAQRRNREAQLLLGKNHNRKYLYSLIQKGDIEAFTILISNKLDMTDSLAAIDFVEKFFPNEEIVEVSKDKVIKECQTNNRIFLIEHAANKGYIPAIRQMTINYSNVGDYRNAIRWAERIDTLTTHDQKNLAILYYNIHDYKKAWPFLLKLDSAQDVIFPITPILLAEFYYEGYVNKPDYVKVMKYLKQAQELDIFREWDSRIYYYWGMCYLKGNGVAIDEAKGFKYMKKAVECNSVYIKAFWEISKCYRFGRGVGRDLKKAEEYEEKATLYKNEDALWLREQQMQ